MASNSSSVDPSKFQNEVFDLYSIPAFDKGKPEVIVGGDIGSTKQVVKPGDVLLSRIVPHIRRAWVVGKHRGRRLIASGEWIVFRSEKIDPNYLRHVLVEDLFHAKFMQTVSGVGGSLLRARPAQVADIEIPVPPLPEQRRVAALLEKADRLCRTRRYAHQLGDTFLQSVFLEMFGALFQRDVSKTRFGDLVKITGGGTPSRDIAAYFTGTIPWLTSKDMRAEYIFDTQEHITEDAVANSATHVVPAGSILVVVKSKVLMHRLPVAISVVPLCHGQDIKSIQCSNELLPEFARCLLRYYERHLLNLARGANTEGLTLPMLNELLVPDVSLPLQHRFAGIVRRFERLRAQQREAERQANHLFQTLLHRAFAEPVSMLPEGLDSSRKIFSAEDYFGQLIPALVSACGELPLEKLNSAVALLFLPRILEPMMEGSGNANAQQHFTRFNQPLEEAAFRIMLTLLVKNSVIRFDPKDPTVVLRTDKETLPPVEPIVADDARYLATIAGLVFPDAVAEKARKILPKVARRELISSLPS